MPGESLKLFCTCSVNNAFLSAGLFPADLSVFKNCLPVGDLAKDNTTRLRPAITGATIYMLLIKLHGL